MAVKYVCKNDIEISHEIAMELLKSERLKLGLRQEIADTLLRSGAFLEKMQNPGRSSADTIWIILSIFIVLGSFVASFLFDWWYFMFGLIWGTVFYLATRKDKTEMLTDLARRDKAVFEEIQRRKGWNFYLRTDVAEEFGD